MFQLNVLFYFDNFAGKENILCKCIYAKNVHLKFWELSLWFICLCILSLHMCVCNEFFSILLGKRNL